MPTLRDQAARVLETSIACDVILPWSDYGDRSLRAGVLPRYMASGFRMVSLSLTSDAEGPERLLHMLARVRREIMDDPRLELIADVDDIRRAREAGRLAVSLNLQGTNNLGRNLDLVRLWYDLGIRQMVLVYNHKNAVGDGCHERTDGGLSRYGVELIAEMNAVGMLIDCSHTGYRTSMEAIEQSKAPVIFSHSNPRQLWEHDRNIRDDQARACTSRGGFIGVAGVGIFMGNNDASTETVFRQVDYWVTLVGAECVGLGTDFVYDPDDMQRYMRSVKSPAAGNYDQMTAFFQPEQLIELVERMLRAGYGTPAIQGILGENYLRVADQVWRGDQPESR